MVRDAACGNLPGARAEGRVQVEDARLTEQVPVAGAEARGVYPGPAACQLAGGQPRVLKRFPRRLQEQPVLRIEPDRLPRAQAEETSVEFVDVSQETAGHQ